MSEEFNDLRKSTLNVYILELIFLKNSSMMHFCQNQSPNPTLGDFNLIYSF